jgi:hypothetical protein
MRLRAQTTRRPPTPRHSARDPHSRPRESVPRFREGSVPREGLRDGRSHRGELDIMHRSVAGSKLRFSVAHASGEVRLLSSHFAPSSDAPSRLEPLLAVLGGAIAPRPALGRSRPNAATRSSPNPNHRVLSRKSEKVNRAPTRARSRAGGGEHASRARAPRSRRHRNNHSTRTAAHRPFPPSSRRRLARLVPCPLPDDRLERARNTHPRFFRVKIHHRVSETNRIPITPRASSTSTRPRRAVGNARASLSSRRSWYSVWTTPLGSTRSSF